MAIFYMPFLIAFIISIMVEPIIKWFSRKTKIQRKPSAIIVLVLVFGIIVGLLVWGIAVLIDEGANLLKMINEYVGTGYSYVLDLIDKLNFDELRLSEEVVNMLKQSMSNFLQQVSNFAINFLTSMMSVFTSIATVRNIYSSYNTCNLFYVCR